MKKDLEEDILLLRIVIYLVWKDCLKSPAGQIGGVKQNEPVRRFLNEVIANSRAFQ
jgi:hypothetical protein